MTWLYLKDFQDWYDSVSHTYREGSAHEDGAQAGWNAAMRFMTPSFKVDWRNAELTDAAPQVPEAATLGGAMCSPETPAVAAPAHKEFELCQQCTTQIRCAAQRRCDWPVAS